MRQATFEARHGPFWAELETRLALEREADPRFPADYRALCAQLALARQRGYAPALSDYLQSLVHRGHARLYGAVAARPLQLRQWLLADFPQRVREEWRLLALTLLAFFGVAAIVAGLVANDPQWAYRFASPSELHHYQEMYQPEQMAKGRDGDGGDVAMFGFYIWNNVSIGFRTFASGIFAGVPTLLSLAFNGLQLGLVGSWLSLDESTRLPFWSFVITHTSFEITGLLLSALAGLRLGLSLLRPGRLTRRHALQTAASRLYPVMVGAALLTVLAAFVEAFWSASPNIAPSVKFAVGGLCWTLVLSYFLFVGRRRG